MDRITDAIVNYKRYRDNHKLFRHEHPEICFGFWDFKQNNPNINITYFRFYRERLFDFYFNEFLEMNKYEKIKF